MIFLLQYGFSIILLIALTSNKYLISFISQTRLQIAQVTNKMKLNEYRGDAGQMILKYSSTALVDV